MSLPGRRARRLVGVVVLASTVTACGFEPLHGAGVMAALGEVGVAPIPGGAGELLHQALVDRLHPPGRPPGVPAYRLDITLRQENTPLIIDQSTFVRRYDIHLHVRYRLVEIATGRELGSAERDARASHGVIPNEIYGTLVSSKTALRRAADVLADVIAADAALLIRSEARG